MSARTYTPGPWTAAPFSSVVGCPITAQPDKAKNTIVIAGVHSSFGDDYRAGVIANARLIAGSPELFEALFDWRACWLCPATDFEGQISRLLKVTDAAFRKVRGETPNA